MTLLPDRIEQIRRMHAAFIRQVVAACQNPEARRQVEALLGEAAQSGWQELVVVLRRIINGERDTALLNVLDEEDSVIAEAILQGLQDPTSLPPIQEQADPSLAAPGLASIIHAAGSGDTRALKSVAEMAEQMLRVGGDMARLGGVMRKLINGERDPDRLYKGMDPSGKQLVLSLVEELGKLGQH